MSSKYTNEEVQKILDSFGYKLVEYISKDDVKFICKCGDDRKTSLLCIRKGVQCRKCKSKGNFIPQDTEEEKWAKFHDRWISSLGKVKNENGQSLDLYYEGDRVRFSSNNFNYKLYLARTMAIAFKIKDYEKLNNDDGTSNLSYDVSYIDNSKNIILDNLIVEERKGKLRQSSIPFSTERSKEFLRKDEKECENIEHKFLKEFPDYKFYKNGFIWNGCRFIAGTIKTSGYIYCQLKYKKEDNIETKDFAHHRLICMAFHPIEGKTKYDDYDNLQVNHKDGNKQNNSADNLEWCSQSHNQLHLMTLVTTKKGRYISQYDCKTNEKLNTFRSLADAGRYLYEVRFGKFNEDNATEEDKKEWKKKCNSVETHIRDNAKGKNQVKKEFIWRYEDEEKNDEYSSKYSKR
jgi:hypothetical protein